MRQGSWPEARKAPNEGVRCGHEAVSILFQTVTCGIDATESAESAVVSFALVSRVLRGLEAEVGDAPLLAAFPHGLFLGEFPQACKAIR